MDFQSLRREYRQGRLTESEVDPDAIRQFELWFAQAIQAQVPDVEAMTLATAAPGDAPSAPAARTVLLKGFDARGFVFYTNYDSAKAAEMAANPRAALLFFWKELERQIRIAGRVDKVGRAQSEEYFATRPRGSQLAAWASDQSRPARDRAELEARLAEITARFEGAEVPCPPHWGGYRVSPDSIEFWQGGADRVHDRLLYTRAGDNWTIQRLWP